MRHLAKAVLLVGSLAAVTGVGLAVAVASLPDFDPNHYCQTGYSRLSSCKAGMRSQVTQQGAPNFGASASGTDTLSPGQRPERRLIAADAMLWAIAECPENAIARRLICANATVATPVAIPPNNLAAGLPLPKPWMIRTAKNSPFIEAVHVETPLELAAVLKFYRDELSKRGWTETSGAIVAPNRAVIAFTTDHGPALLRLVHQDGRTIADLSVKKPAATAPGIVPRAGQARLVFGNATDEAAVITINDQTIELKADTGGYLTDDARTARKAPDSPDIDLPPGRIKVTFKIASGAAQSREFEIAADETWGLLVGPAAVPLPVRLY